MSKRVIEFERYSKSSIYRALTVINQESSSDDETDHSLSTSEEVELIRSQGENIHMIVLREDKAPEELDVEVQKKSGKGAGLCITGFKSGKGAYVSDMFPGGSALESGKIVKGDRIISICGQDVREASVEDIAFHIKVSNPVQLKLARYKPTKQ